MGQVSSRHFCGQLASEERQFHAFETTFRCAKEGEPISEITSRSVLRVQERATELGDLIHIVLEGEYPKGQHSMLSALAKTGLVSNELMPHPDLITDMQIPLDDRLLRDRTLSTAVWALEDGQISAALVAAERDRLGASDTAEAIERRHGFTNLVRPDGEERSFVLDMFRFGPRMPVSVQVKQHIVSVLEQELPDDQVHTVRVPTSNMRESVILGAFAKHVFDGVELEAVDSEAGQLLAPDDSDRLWEVDIDTLLTAVVRGEIDRLVEVVREDAPVPGQGKVYSGVQMRWENLYQLILAADYFSLPQDQVEAYQAWLA